MNSLLVGVSVLFTDAQGRRWQSMPDGSLVPRPPEFWVTDGMDASVSNWRDYTRALNVPEPPAVADD